MKDIDYLKKYGNPANYQNDFNRLQDGEPVQYIVGEVEFYNRIYKIDSRVLIPRFETEQLIELTIKEIISKFQNKPIKILDIGTGSGCIAITLKKELPNSIVDAIDISLEALEVARINAKNNNADINFIKSDIFSNVEDKYDVIISNPPYIANNEKIMPVVYNNEPHLALFAENDGLYFYDMIIRNMKKYLNSNFIVAMEIGQNQGSKILDIGNKNLENVNFKLIKDYQQNDRFIIITSK